MVGIFFLFCFFYLNSMPLTPPHYNIVANLNGKCPHLCISLPTLTNLPMKLHHCIWPLYCCSCCAWKRERTQCQILSCCSNSTIYLKNTSCIFHSGLLHNDKALLSKQLLFKPKGYFCIKSLDPAEHLLLGSSWHKTTALIIFEMIFRLQNIVDTKAGLIFDNCQRVSPSNYQNLYPLKQFQWEFVNS